MRPAFVLRWQTRFMPAPAFWYFATREKAQRAADLLTTGTNYTVEQTEVSDDYELDD